MADRSHLDHGWVTLVDFVKALAGAAAAGGILLVLTIILIVRERWRREQERQRISDAAFEAEALAFARSSGVLPSLDTQVLGWDEPVHSAGQFIESPPSAPLPNDRKPAASLPEQNVAANATDLVVPQNAMAETDMPFIRRPAEITCSSVLRQLQNAGMVEQQEGYVELHGNSRAAISVRLKGGKHCLIVPYHETELFTQRNLKRFQVLIYVGRDGKGTVLKSLEETIAEQVGGSFGM